MSEAAALTKDEPTAGQDTTAGLGQLALALKVGLYLVQETAAPNTVVPSAPFLVSLPHTSGDGQWLYTVHVYPKNAVVNASLSVNDVDAVTCGDAVTWTSRTAIPHRESIDSYVVQNILAPSVLLAGSLSDINVNVVGTSITPSDYTVEKVEVDGKEALQVTFNEAGRAKLVAARQANPAAEVTISYSTVVMGPGNHINEVRLLAGNAGLVSDTAETRFGPLKILVHEKGKPANLIEGAIFEVYLTLEDAAARRNPIIVDGSKQWTTDKDGMITVGCLRFSDFVNGVDVPKTDPNFRYYYAQPVSYPSGWEGDMAPLAGIVNSTVAAEAMVLEFQVSPPTPPGPAPDPTPKPTPKPNLPVTGAQVAGVGLLALALLGAGSMFVAGRRREKPGEENASQ